MWDRCSAKHRNKTEIRFSLNTTANIAAYEHGTPVLTKRLEAARAIAKAGYPLGFLIAPVITGEHWEKDYFNLLEYVRADIYPVYPQLTFEIITHRFTMKAKEHIKALFPDTCLPLVESERQFKYGQFGYGKYLYPSETMTSIVKFFTGQITKLLPKAQISYIV